MNRTSEPSAVGPGGTRLWTGNEAVAHAALAAGVALGTGYPGTPSTEILEAFSAAGGRAQWAPNEKVALEVAIGVAFAGARALVTMKHVGLNVAADPLFTVAQTGVDGALVVVVCDDPGMHSSQNEQDSRRHAVAAGVPLLDAGDSHEAYEFVFRAVEISERWGRPVLLRLTTRVSHTRALVRPEAVTPCPPPSPPHFTHRRADRVMIPGHARAARRRHWAAIEDLRAWNETSGPTVEWPGDGELGIIATGVCAMYAREAAPGARVLKPGLLWPWPLERMRAFARSVRRCLVVEEGDPVLEEAVLAAGVRVEPRPAAHRFGEMDVARVRARIEGRGDAETVLPAGRPPELCAGCPHRAVFEILRDEDCIVAGDIGCYTLGVRPPFEAMDTCICMGAAIGVGLGLRHALPPATARRVVSVMGDSTFFHSGIPGLVEMVYNPPPTGHVVVILDNGTTAMTGLQDHPGTGRRLDGTAVPPVACEEIARSLGIHSVAVFDPNRDGEGLRHHLRERLASDELSVIVARRPCMLMQRRAARQRGVGGSRAASG